MQNLKVIYEDNHIIVVEKTPNIPSQSDKTGDMDMLTIVKQYITEKYNVDLPKHLYKYGNYKKGKPEYLTYDFLDNFINEVIDKKIEDRIKELKGEYYEYKN